MHVQIQDHWRWLDALVNQLVADSYLHDAALLRLRRDCAGSSEDYRVVAGCALEYR